MKKRIIIMTIAALLVLLAPGLRMLAADEEPQEVAFRGVVLRVDDAPEGSPLEEGGFDSKAYYADVRVTSGPYRGQTISVYHLTSGEPAFDIIIHPGDKVVLLGVVRDDVLQDVYITSYVRDTYVYWMAGLFVLLVLLLGGKAGLKSLISLALTAGMLCFVYLPLLLKGHQPILLAVAVSAASVVATMFIVGGINHKTIAAILGTVGGVVIAGLLAFGVGRIAHLTGLSAEEAQMLSYIPQNVKFDYQGLLFGGMMIGALGAVMDVGMSISSSLFEMRRLRPDLHGWPLFRSGMNVGRDIMGTMTNTLILAYAGGSTSLLLLFQAYQVSLQTVMNLDLVATEIVRALSGSIGLVAAIPLTALAAAWLSRRGQPVAATPVETGDETAAE